MFDTIIHQTKKYPVTRIIEKSISPDKVTDLYLKTKDEIMGEIINNVDVKNNLFEAHYKVYKKVETNSIIFNYIIKINDKKITGKIETVEYIKEIMESKSKMNIFFIEKILDQQLDKLSDLIK